MLGLYLLAEQLMKSNQQIHAPGILVIGSSLLLEGAAAILAAEPGIRVMRIEGATDKLGQFLSGLWPEVIIFELDQPGAAEIMRRCEILRHPLLIGLDQAQNRLVVLPGTEKYEPTTADLCQLVLGAISCPAQ